MQGVSRSLHAAAIHADAEDAEQEAQASTAVTDREGPVQAVDPGIWPDAGAVEADLFEQTLLFASVVDALEAEGRLMVRSLLHQ